jgi:hypothetical protein
MLHRPVIHYIELRDLHTARQLIRGFLEPFKIAGSNRDGRAGPSKACRCSEPNTRTATDNQNALVIEPEDKREPPCSSLQPRNPFLHSILVVQAHPRFELPYPEGS